MNDVLKGKSLLGVIATAGVMAGVAFGVISSASADDPGAEAQPAAHVVPATAASAKGNDAPDRPEAEAADSVATPAVASTPAAVATPAMSATP